MDSRSWLAESGPETNALCPGQRLPDQANGEHRRCWGIVPEPCDRGPPPRLICRCAGKPEPIPSIEEPGFPSGMFFEALPFANSPNATGLPFCSTLTTTCSRAALAGGFLGG